MRLFIKSEREEMLLGGFRLSTVCNTRNIHEWDELGFPVRR